MRRLHPSDAGTAGQLNIPPDPGETNRYIEFSTLESQHEEAHMHHEEANYNSSPNKLIDNVEADAMSQGTDHGEIDTNPPTNHNDSATATDIVSTMEQGPHDVSGRINDDNLIDMMAREAVSMQPLIATDISLDGHDGRNKEIC